MKIILQNNQEVEVTRISEMLENDDWRLSISFSTDETLDSLKSLFEDNTETIKIQQYGKERVFEGYRCIQSLMRDISDYGDQVHITLSKDEN